MLHVLLAGCAESIFWQQDVLKGLWHPRSLDPTSLTYCGVLLKITGTKNIKKVTLALCLIKHRTIKLYGGVSALLLVPKQCQHNTTKREYSECELQYHRVNSYACLSRHVQRDWCVLSDNARHLRHVLWMHSCVFVSQICQYLKTIVLLMWWLVNDNLERMWQEVVMAWLRYYLSYNLPGGGWKTMINQDCWCCDWYLNQESSIQASPLHGIAEWHLFMFYIS